MRNFQDTFETCKRSIFSAFSICMTVPLNGIILPHSFLNSNKLFLLQEILGYNIFKSLCNALKIFANYSSEPHLDFAWAYNFS